MPPTTTKQPRQPRKRKADAVGTGSSSTAIEAPVKRQKKAAAAASSAPPPRTKPATTATTTANSSALFPRGGASVLTPLEIRKIHKEAQHEVEETLFRADGLAGAASKRKKAGSAGKQQHHRGAGAAAGVRPRKTDTVYDSDEEISARMQLLTPPKSVHSISASRVQVGMVFVGAIRSIRDSGRGAPHNGLGITLPNQLRARARWQEISALYSSKVDAYLADNAAATADDDDDDVDNSSEPPSLYDMFKVGQLVRCIVVAVTPSEKHGVAIEVSLRPSLLNSSGRFSFTALEPGSFVCGTVQSEEDNGWVVSFEAEGKGTGFISRKDAIEHQQQLVAGAPVNCVVLAAPGKNHTVPLSVAAKELSSTTAIDHYVLNINTLSAGTLVKAQIRAVINGGLFVTFMSYSGTVARAHLPSPQQLLGDDLSQHFKENQRVMARIIFIDYENKSIELSLRPHVVAWRPIDFPPAFKLGTIVPEAQVLLSTSHVVELLVPAEQPPGDDAASASKATAVLGVSNKLHATDSKQELHQLFPAGSSTTCRVVGFNRLDGSLIMSMQQSILQQKLYSYADVEVGSIVRGVIKEIPDNERGVVVELTPRIRGFVPHSHLADVAIRKIGAKFKIDQKVKCRVLRLDVAKRDLILSCKRTLVNSDLPLITSFSGIKAGVITHGVITAIKPFGCLVSFYNGVVGLAPLRHLAAEPVAPADVPKLFQLNQPVKCRVLFVKPKIRSLVVSFITQIADTPNAISIDEQKAAAFVQIAVGSVVENATVTAKTSNGISVVLPDGFQGHVAIEHLSDHQSLTTELHSAIQVGAVLSPLLVISKSDQRLRLNLSRKPSLIESVRRLGCDTTAAVATEVENEDESTAAATALEPQKRAKQRVDAFELNKLYHGYVMATYDAGVVVRFMAPAIASGFSHKALLADRYVGDPASFFVVGQSVRALVCKLEPESGTMHVSLKQSACASNDVSFMMSRFADQQLVLESAHADKLKRWSSDKRLALGAVLPVSVSLKQEYGVVVELGARYKGIVGFVTKEQCDDFDAIAPGDEFKARILDIDREKSIVDLSLRAALVDVVKRENGSKSDDHDHDHDDDHDDDDKKKKKETKKETKETQPKSSNSDNSGVIEIVKAHYLIVSLHNGAELAFVAARDYNTATFQDPFTMFRVGMRLVLHPRSGTTPDGRTARVLQPRASSASTRTKRSASQVGSEDEIAANKIDSIDDVVIGAKLAAKITHIFKGHMLCAIGMHVRAHVHITEVTDTLISSHPFAEYAVGDIVHAKVLAITEKRGKALPFSHQVAASVRVVQLTLRPSELLLIPPALGPPRPTLKTLKKGERLPGFVNGFSKELMWIDLAHSLTGCVHPLHASNDPRVLNDLQGHFTVGQSVEVTVLSIGSRYPQLSLLPPAEPPSAANASKQHAKGRAASKTTTPGPRVTVGAIIPARIVAFTPYGITVQLDRRVFGLAHHCDVSDIYQSRPSKVFNVGEYTLCKVLGQKHDSYDVSLRKSDTLPEQSNQIVDAAFESVEQLTEGQIIRGFVTKADQHKGVFVSIGRNLTARILIAELSDGFIKDIEVKFPVGKLVLGKITSIIEGRVELSLKRSVVYGIRVLKFADLQVGMKVKATVSSIKDYGIFIRVKDSINVSGLCHRSEILDAPSDGAGEPVVPEADAAAAHGKRRIKKERDEAEQEAENAQWKTLYQVGDYVKAVVLAVDKQKHRVSFGLKPSYFTAADLESDDEDDDNESDDDDDLEQPKLELDSDAEGPPEDDEEEEQQQQEDEDEDDAMDAVASDSDDDADSQEDEQDDQDDEDDDAAEEEEDHETPDADEEEQSWSAGFGFSSFSLPRTGTAATSSSASKHHHDDNSSSDESESESESDDDDHDDSSKKKKKKAKRKTLKSKLDEQREIDRIESQLADESYEPENEGDFERLLVGSPNSSYLWIKYMAFLLSVSEVEKARQVCERALKRIHFREEHELENVWKAYLNLENMYGSSDTLLDVVQRALARAKDARNIYFHLLDIYRQSNKIEEARNIAKRMLSKFKDSTRVWLKYALFELELNQSHDDGVQPIMKRAIQSLPQRKHVSAISKFGQLEFRHGNAERGRTIFENLLSHYPKRVDIWSVYIDMEQKFVGDLEAIRHIFDKATSLFLSAKKMKFLFKRYLTFEKQHGNAAGIEKVKRKAQEYLAAKAEPAKAE